MGVFIKALLNTEMAIPVKAVFHNMSEYDPIRKKVNMITNVEWSDGSLSEGIKHCGCAYIIIDGEKKILVDTGAGDIDLITKIRHNRGDKFYLKQISSVPDKLAELGIRPNDIDVVINTHLHWDHCGGNKYFPNAKFFLPEADISLAMLCPRWAPHFFPELRHCIMDIIDRAVMVRGDVRVSDNVSIVRLGGHTPGSLGVLVNTKKHNIVALPGDVVCKYENLDFDWIGPAGNIWNVTELADAVNRLRSISDVIIPSHDWTIFDRYKNGVISSNF